VCGSRYWDFQGIETGSYILIVAALITATIAVIRCVTPDSCGSPRFSAGCRPSDTWSLPYRRPTGRRRQDRRAAAWIRDSWTRWPGAARCNARGAIAWAAGR
jgi:hypothetical protein